MKPWLQGRLALSKQTSRFELPMDVRLLEGRGLFIKSKYKNNKLNTHIAFARTVRDWHVLLGEIRHSLSDRATERFQCKQS